MHKHDNTSKTIIRYNPKFNLGLTKDEVISRNEEHLNNETQMVVGKSNWEIIKTDVLSFFNILLFFLTGLIIYANVNDPSGYSKWYSGTLFILICIANIVIGLYQDIKAKRLMKKMKLLTDSKSRVIRDGTEEMINPSEIVLDDILFLKSSEQISADSIILEGEVLVNESLLTGESIDILKKKGDMIFSGTYITSGSCYSKVEHVGKDNYIETISAKAKAFKRNPSHILKSLKKVFRFLGILIVTLFVITMTTYGIQGAFASKNDFVRILHPLASQFVAMVPAGLYLLTSITLATGVISLYRKRANVQDLYSIEMLARSEVLCVDKTGTITDGTMVLKEIKPLAKINAEQIGEIVANLINATKDNNATAAALKNSIALKKKAEVSAALPFTSDNKYSGVTFVTGSTYILGAAEFLNLKDKEKIIKQSEEYTSKGLRVLLLAKGDKAIKGKSYKDEVVAVGFVVLKDHIKESAVKTFAWFNENGVEVKVISGDNALTVSEIAQEAGIKEAHKYISLEGMSIDEVKKIANDYVVFGRVTPEQKEALVIAIKESGKTVAMTGDGANDMLALKRADCSIAMNSGAQAAKNVSHIVLLDNDFSTMPEIVGEGRRVINNVERTGSLFLTKTFFAIVCSIVFWIISIATANKYSYPFCTNNLIVWEIFGFGLSAFFISLERNPKPITKGFLSNILSKAIPSALILLLGVATVYVCFVLQKNGLVYTGVSEFGFDSLHPRDPRTGATAISILVFTALSLVILFNTCRPINKYRGFVVFFAVFFSALCFGIGSILPNNLFLIDFNKITNANLLLWACITIICGALIYFINPISNAFINLFKKITKKTANK